MMEITSMKIRTMAAVLAWVMLARGGAVSAELEPGAPGPGEKVERKGPLAGLPSRPGAHLARIRALGDNAWLNLGAPKPDPKWGPGRGRSWGAKMPYAPELRGAFLVGQGKHGYIRPDGRYDDIYFYDVNAHAWVCVYPGINTKTFVQDIKDGKLKLNGDGQLVDKDGQPILYAYGGHSYQTHAYDRDNRKWVTVWNRSGLGGDQYSFRMAWEVEGRKLLKEQMKGKTDKMSGRPFHFNTVTGKFERYAAKGSKVGGGTGGVLYYLPTKKKLWAFNGRRNETLFGDPLTGKWLHSGAKGPTPTGIDFGACYDSKRHRVYVGGGSYRKPWGENEGKIYVYDVATNTWSNVKRGPHRDKLEFSTNYSVTNYDSAADRVVVITRWPRRPEFTGVRIFNPETQTWKKEVLPLAKGMSGGCGHGFYDPELNVHFLYVAHDSSPRGTLWVYRYKRRPAKAGGDGEPAGPKGEGTKSNGSG